MAAPFVPGPAARRRIRRAAARPGRPLQAEAIAGNHAAARRRALEARPDVNEPAFFEHAARRRIFDMGGGEHFDGAGQREAGLDRRQRGLGRQALAPDFRRERIAQGQAALQAALQADHADRIALAANGGDDEDEVAPERIGLARGEDEALGFAGRIGMGNARGHLRDFPAARIALDRRRRRRRAASAARAASSPVERHRRGRYRETSCGSGPKGPARAAPRNDEGEVAPHFPLQALEAYRTFRGRVSLAFDVSRAFLETVRGAGAERGLVSAPLYSAA